MSNPAPLLKSQMLRRSLRCLALGWWSLIPVAGLVPALFALLDFRDVVLSKGERWNAARPQLLLGVWLAGAGVSITLAAVAITVLVIIANL
jgi:hypothetical protein